MKSIVTAIFVATLSLAAVTCTYAQTASTSANASDAMSAGEIKKWTRAQAS